MLATDLHSPAIKDKMKKEQWIPMQLKNFDNKIDKQVLGEIFDRIAAQKLTVNGSDDDLNLDSNGKYRVT
jgi:Sec7-like guanine-nucleotide exchange factor